MAVVNGGCLHYTDIKKFFFSGTAKKTKLALKILVNDPGPSWPSCCNNSKAKSAECPICLPPGNVFILDKSEIMRLLLRLFESI